MVHAKGDSHVQGDSKGNYDVGGDSDGDSHVWVNSKGLPVTPQIPTKYGHSTQ